MKRIVVLFMGINVVISLGSVFGYDWLIYPHDLTTEDLNFIDAEGFLAPGDNGVVLWCDYPDSKIMPDVGWRDISPPTSLNLYGAAYRGDFYVVGDSGVIIYSSYLGDWYFVDSPTTESLYSVTLSVDMYSGFMVGANGTILYGGSSSPVWNLYEPSPTTNDLYSVCGEPDEPNTTWAVGAGGTILDYQDGVWTLYPSSPTSEDLFSVYVEYDHPYTWACGANGTILRWDGSSWSKINNIPTTDNLYCIWGFADNPPYYDEAIFCVGAGGTILASEDLGLTWHAETCPVTVDLHGVGGYSVWVWAVGDDGTILSHGEVSQSIRPDSLGRVKALYYCSTSVNQKQPMSKIKPVLPNPRR